MRVSSKLVAAMVLACVFLGAPRAAFADDNPHSTLTNWRVFGDHEGPYTVKEGGALTITTKSTCVESSSGQKCVYESQGVFSLAHALEPSAFNGGPDVAAKIKALLTSEDGLDVAAAKSALPKQDFYVLPGTSMSTSEGPDATPDSTIHYYTSVIKVGPVNDCVKEGPEVAIAWEIARIDQPYHEPFKILTIHPVVINDGTCKNKFPHLYRENIRKYTLEPIYRLNPSRAMCRLPALEEIRSECLATRRAAGRRLNGLLRTRERCGSSVSKRCRRARSILRAIGYSRRPRTIVSPQVPGLTSVAAQQTGGPSQPSTGAPTETTPTGPKPACSDGQDNDGDGKVDGADPGCSADADDSEADPATAAPAECADGQDNDRDGLTDGRDPGCSDGTEAPNNSVVIGPR